MKDQQKIEILEWIVGSGSAEAAKRAEALTEANAEARAYADEIRILRDALTDAEPLDESEAESLAESLRRRVGQDLARKSRRIWWRPRAIGAAAAVLALMVGAAWFFAARGVSYRGEILYPREGAGGAPHEETSRVAAGEEIVTREGRGILTFDDGSRFVLRSGTRLRVGQKAHILCTFEEGFADARAASGVINWRDVSTELHHAVLSISSSPRGFFWRIYRGEVRIQTGSQSWTVSAGNAAAWTDGKMTISPLPATELPADETLRILEWGY